MVFRRRSTLVQRLLRQRLDRPRVNLSRENRRITTGTRILDRGRRRFTISIRGLAIPHRRKCEELYHSLLTARHIDTSLTFIPHHTRVTPHAPTILPNTVYTLTPSHTSSLFFLLSPSCTLTFVFPPHTHENGCKIF
jgi:hypothetical protein